MIFKNYFSCILKLYPKRNKGLSLSISITSLLIFFSDLTNIVCIFRYFMGWDLVQLHLKEIHPFKIFNNHMLALDPFHTYQNTPYIYFFLKVQIEQHNQPIAIIYISIPLLCTNCTLLVLYIFSFFLRSKFYCIFSMIEMKNSINTFYILEVFLS